MYRVRRICGRDLGELERELNEFLKMCNELHYIVRHIDFVNSNDSNYTNAFVQYETFDSTEEVIEED